MKTTLAQAVLSDANYAKQLQNYLDQVENELNQELNQGADFLIEPISHLARAGGKRFRPLFTLLCAGTCAQLNAAQVIKASVVVELVHLATLYHDDVMDESELRRGVATVQTKWGNNRAILAGDYLFARAAALSADLGVKATRELATTYGKLVTGQYREGIDPGNRSRIDHYLETIYEKTGSLMGCCGKLAGLVCNADEEHIQNLKLLGEKLGIAFQIMDDIIDLRSSADDSGKVPAADLREGVNTLPILFALDGDDSIAKELASLLNSPITDPKLLKRAQELLLESDGIEKSVEVLEQYCRECEQIVSKFSDDCTKAALLNLIKFTKGRIK